MAKQKKLTISFSKEFDAEYDYVLGLSNSSDFICNAIREKMKRNGYYSGIDKMIMVNIDR